MITSSTFAKGVVAAVAGVMALGAAASAQAQPYGYYGDQSYGNGYNTCERSANNRGIVGALVGGGLGATLGSQMAASGHRTDGSLLGGVLGAVGGAVVGKKSAACGSAPYQSAPYQSAPAPRTSYYEGNSYNQYGYNGYDRGRAYRYGSVYEDDYAYGGRGERLRVVDSPVGADGCTLAESPIYLPDGRVQKRFVRVCMDSSGRYQVVD